MYSVEYLGFIPFPLQISVCPPNDARRAGRYIDRGFPCRLGKQALRWRDVSWSSHLSLDLRWGLEQSEQLFLTVENTFLNNKCSCLINNPNLSSQNFV